MDKIHIVAIITIWLNQSKDHLKSTGDLWACLVVHKMVPGTQNHKENSSQWLWNCGNKVLLFFFFFLPPCLIKHGPLASLVRGKPQHKATHQSTFTSGLPSHHASTQHESFHHLNKTKSHTYCVSANPILGNHGPVALWSSNPATPRPPQQYHRLPGP